MSCFLKSPKNCLKLFSSFSSMHRRLSKVESSVVFEESTTKTTKAWIKTLSLARGDVTLHTLIDEDEVVLEKHVSKLEQLENATKKVLKDAKKYEDLILELSISEKAMTEDLSGSLLCQEEEKLRSLIEEWHTFVSQSATYNEDLILITRCTVVEPLKKFQRVFADTRGALKKRDQAMQDCVKASQKVQKLQEKEKTGSNIVKLESARQNLANLEQDFRAQDKILKSELPLLYEGRIEYFQPCLEALIKAQVEHNGNSATLFSETVQSVNNFTMSETELRDIQNQRFQQIYSLSIVEDK